MKPVLLAALTARGQGPVLLIDADGLVCESLEEAKTLAERHAVVLSPHTLGPHPSFWPGDGADQQLARAGVFNAGVIAAGPGAEPFLDWWGERTSRHCVFDLPRGLMCEQTWLALVPALFAHAVWRDPGVNVAGWNLHGRDLEWVAERPTIEGGPLRHFHFACSYDPAQPDRLTTQPHAHWWPVLEERPGVARLSHVYARRLIEAGYDDARARPDGFDAMPGGAPLQRWMRAVYRAELLAAERGGAEEPPNPFTHGPERFGAWVRARAEEGIDAVSGREEPTVAPSRAEDGGPEMSTRELAGALMETRAVLARIAELERIRDEAIAWAQRASAELQQAAHAISERDAVLRECDELMSKQAQDIERIRAALDEVWTSPSWRITKPLRAARALVRLR